MLAPCSLASHDQVVAGLSEPAAIGRILGPMGRRVLDLAMERGDLMAQDEDLGVLGAVGEQQVNGGDNIIGTYNHRERAVRKDQRVRGIGVVGYLLGDTVVYMHRTALH